MRSRNHAPKNAVSLIIDTRSLYHSFTKKSTEYRMKIKTQIRHNFLYPILRSYLVRKTGRWTTFATLTMRICKHIRPLRLRRRFREALSHKKTGRRLPTCFFGAENGTWTRTVWTTRPSNVRVCQFRHSRIKYWIVLRGYAQVAPQTCAVCCCASFRHSRILIYC